MTDAVYKRCYSHLNTAAAVLQQYDGGQPFSIFLKSFFSAHKKFGSRDRRQIAGLCYGYFRLGKSFPDTDTMTRLLLGVKYAGSPDRDFKDLPEYDGLPDHVTENIFPWKDQLSKGIDAAAFEQSFLVQPDLFLRMRPGHEKTVLQKLTAAGIGCQQEGTALRLNNSEKIDDVIALNKEAVIQDFSSQRVGDLLQNLKPQISNLKFSVWDCCAASGGKSILAKDVLGNILLTVSDIRPSILQNLQHRFKTAGMQDYRAFEADLTNKNDVPDTGFDLVIADVPCSGSGTWSRTPEELFYFTNDKLAYYTALQQKIVNNIVHAVKPGGYLLYITCSVFAAENENQVGAVLKNDFQLVEKQLIKGYDHKADTMFAALLKKNVEM